MSDTNVPTRFVLLGANGVSAHAYTVATSIEQAASHFAAHVRGAKAERVRIQGPAFGAVDGSVTIVATGKVLGGAAPAPAEERPALPKRRRSGSESIARRLMGR